MPDNPQEKLNALLLQMLTRYRKQCSDEDWDRLWYLVRENEMARDALVQELGKPETCSCRTHYRAIEAKLKEEVSGTFEELKDVVRKYERRHEAAKARDRQEPAELVGLLGLPIATEKKTTIFTLTGVQ